MQLYYVSRGVNSEPTFGQAKPADTSAIAALARHTPVIDVHRLWAIMPFGLYACLVL